MIIEFPQVMAQALATRDDLLIVVVDLTGRLLWANQAFITHSQRSLEALVGQPFLQVFAPQAVSSSQQTHLWEQLTQGIPFKVEVACPASEPSLSSWWLIDGQPTADAEGTPGWYSILIQDITSQKQTELALHNTQRLLEHTTRDLETQVQQRTAALRREKEQAEQALVALQQTQTLLVQQEKMSSLGQLVAGIAHEINNPVNFIHGNITYARTYAEELLSLIQLYEKAYPHPASDIVAKADSIDLTFLRRDLLRLLDSMQSGTDRIREIVMLLRNFSRTDESDLKPVDVHSGIDSALVLLRHRLQKNPEFPITVNKTYGSLPMIECYPDRLNQVFMSILVNAIDALTADEQAQPSAPRCISIRTDVITPTRIGITIADNGPGIPAAILDRVFDPFFTTKPIGEGTGLGLAIARQIIVEKHHGQLRCTSEVDRGTEFMIELPVRQ